MTRCIFLSVQKKPIMTVKRPGAVMIPYVYSTKSIPRLAGNHVMVAKFYMDVVPDIPAIAYPAYCLVSSMSRDESLQRNGVTLFILSCYIWSQS